MFAFSKLYAFYHLENKIVRQLKHDHILKVKLEKTPICLILEIVSLQNSYEWIFLLRFKKFASKPHLKLSWSVLI